MEALNKKERTIAFLKFLLLFIFTILLVVVAIFIDFQLHKEELKILRSKKHEMDLIKDNHELMTEKFDSLYVTFKNFPEYDDPRYDERKLERASREIDDKIKELEGLVEGNKTQNVSYKVFIDIANNYSQTLDQLISAREKFKEMDEEVKDLKKENNDLDKETRKLQNELLRYKR